MSDETIKTPLAYDDDRPLAHRTLRIGIKMHSPCSECACEVVKTFDAWTYDAAGKTLDAREADLSNRGGELWAFALLQIVFELKGLGVQMSEESRFNLRRVVADMGEDASKYPLDA